MRSTRQLSITLPLEMADMVRAKVASGAYATESEVIRDGLRILQARDRAVDNWLHNKVAPLREDFRVDSPWETAGKELRPRLASESRTTSGNR